MFLSKYNNEPGGIMILLIIQASILQLFLQGSFKGSCKASFKGFFLGVP